MKAPFVFRPRQNLLFSFLAAMFAAKNMPRDIAQSNEITRGPAAGIHNTPGPRKHTISKKERKRRERCRRMNPHRTH